MIVGQRFVWEHMPKTAGDATATMFGMLPDLVQYADELDSLTKHEPYAKRPEAAEFERSGPRQRVVNIRRLPAWMFSVAQHVHRHYGLPFDESDVRQGRVNVPQFRVMPKLYLSLMPKLRRIGPLRFLLNKILTRGFVHESPDDFLKRYDAETVDHWLRQEHLVEDFLKFARRMGEVSHEQEDAIRSLGFVNKNAYKKRWQDFFSREDLANLYGANPLWERIEREVYGDTALGEFRKVP